MYMIIDYFTYGLYFISLLGRPLVPLLLRIDSGVSI